MNTSEVVCSSATYHSPFVYQPAGPERSAAYTEDAAAASMRSAEPGGDYAGSQTAQARPTSRVCHFVAVGSHGGGNDLEAAGPMHRGSWRPRSVPGPLCKLAREAYQSWAESGRK